MPERRWAKMLADLVADPRAGVPWVISDVVRNTIRCRGARRFDVPIGAMDQDSLLRLVGTMNADAVGPFLPGQLLILEVHGEHWPIDGIWNATIAVIEAEPWGSKTYWSEDFGVIPDPPETSWRDRPPLL